MNFKIVLCVIAILWSASWPLIFFLVRNKFTKLTLSDVIVILFWGPFLLVTTQVERFLAWASTVVLFERKSGTDAGEVGDE